MTRCANCKHPVESHNADGCLAATAETTSCDCLFDYHEGGAFNTKNLPVKCRAKIVLRSGGVIECAEDRDGKHWGRYYPTDNFLSWWVDETCSVSLPADDVPNGFAGAASSQVGGNHYSKYKIQPWAIIDEYGLDFYEGSALKYLLRHRDKGGTEDLKKCRHYLDKLIERAESAAEDAGT